MTFDFFKDPRWDGISALIGIASIIVALIVFLLQRRRKNLGYQILVDVQLIHRSKVLGDKLRIMYDDQEVKSVRLQQIRFIANGSKAISASDFERDIRIAYPEDAILLDVFLGQNKPSELNIIADVESHSIRIKPLLLNPGDRFQIQILTTSLTTPIIEGRIKDVSKIEKILVGPSPSRIILISLLIGILLATALAILNEHSWMFLYWSHIFWFGLIMFTMTMLCLFSYREILISIKTDQYLRDTA